MRNIIVLLLMCLATLTASAQQSASEKKILQKISQTASSMKSLQCDFVQTQYSKMLGDKMVSKGKMSYVKPNTLRWEYTTPSVFILTMKDNVVKLQKQEGKKLVDVKGNKYMKRLANLILGSITGKSLSDEKLFKATVKDNGKDYLVTLIPQKRDIKMIYPKMQIIFSKQKEMASQVVMYEKSGDHTVIDFTKR